MTGILLVDDEKNVLMTLSIGLRRYNYSVKQAQNGPEALSILEKESFKFVVSDIRMTPMDGYTLAEQIREKYPDIGIVLMSAYSFENEDPVKANKLKCPRLTKPFEIDELVQILREEEKRTGSRKDHLDNKRILFLTTGEDNEQILYTLRSRNYEVVEANSGKPLKQSILHQTCDLFLIDEGYLDEKGWNQLNEIDRLAPNKPVILLVQKKGKKDHFESSEMNGIVLDRDIFINDETKAFQLLKKQLT